jgi:hypothetical protein
MSRIVSALATMARIAWRSSRAGKKATTKTAMLAMSSENDRRSFWRIPPSSGVVQFTAIPARA